MKKIVFPAFILAICALPAVAQDDIQPPDPKQVSYALGMNLALQSKQVGADLDVNAVLQGIKDVQAGKPTKLKTTELEALFKQEEKYGRAQISLKDQAAGDAFRAKYAKEPGVKALEDGLLYRVLKEGTGNTPKPSDVVTIKYIGRLIDGTKFTESGQLQTSLVTQMRGWQMALEHMKAGSTWEIVLPPHLAYGRNWLRKVGPESTVIFELGLDAIAPSATTGEGPRVIPQ